MSRSRSLTLSSRGVSTIVGEVLIIALMVVALTTVAASIISQSPPRQRYATLEVEVFENTTDSKIANLVIYHRGGATLTDLSKYITVIGGETGVNWWENYAYGYSKLDKLAFGENMTCRLRYAGVNINIQAGDGFWVRVLDSYSDNPLLFDDMNLTVKA